MLAEAHNTVLTGADITAHPELKLARWAARELDPSTAADTTMYTSCQPCGMCAGAIEQLLALKPSGGLPPVRQHGPALLDEARTPVAGYYH